MFSSSDYNDAVPQFTNGNYANTPLNPLYVEEPDAVNYNRGAEPLQTLPAQWWNWLCNKITAKLNKLNIYVKNIFDELAQLLSLVGVTPDATEEEITTGQLKDMFSTKYPQYLFDNFKYESILQGRTRGVMVPPADTMDFATHTLSLSGGFGIIDTYKKVIFSESALVLPNDSTAHYIVSDANGNITIENSISENVILVGLCYDDEYILCKDFVLEQGVDTIKLHKWHGKKLTNSLVTILQSYYDTTTVAIEANIVVNGASAGANTSGANISAYGIVDGTFSNCTIQINGANVSALNGATVKAYGIYGGTFNNCSITMGGSSASATGSSSSADAYCIYGGTFNNCSVTINMVYATGSTAASRSYGIYGGSFNNCSITIDTVYGSGGTVYGIYGGTLSDCTITISMIRHNSGSTNGIYGGAFHICYIIISQVSGSSVVIIANVSSVKMYFVHALLPSTPTLSSVTGKGFVVNDTTIKGF